MKSSYKMLSPNDGDEFISIFSEGDEQRLNEVNIPEQLPVLALRNAVLFPGVIMPINISREKSVKLARTAYSNAKNIAAVMQRDSKQDDPSFDDLHKMGTAARILRLLEIPNGSITIILQGTRRVLLENMVSDDPFFVASVSVQEEIMPAMPNENYDLTVGSVRDVSMAIVKLSPHITPDAVSAIKNIDNRQFLINYLASNTEVSGDEKQKLLELDHVDERAASLLEVLLRERQALELKSEIQQKVNKGIDQHNREFFLHEQMKAIQAELGGNPVEQEVRLLREKAKTKKWNEDVAEVFDREATKTEKMMQHSGEYPGQLNYLQTLVDLPWGEYSEDKLDLDEAQKALDNDHYGLEEVKERMLEHLAVLKLKGDLKSPILCLYGPPGVGKTSLGKSVAKALGREFGRISLGGLHDEAEIRGHRKTYIGAMPGRIVQTIKKCKTSNPVIVLDEVDKVGSDYRGDPSSALLEVLDPEQNSAFHDNFLELDYDLSHVLFITTANNAATIHPALRDRMEMISVSGYTQEEKVEIVKRHLLPRLLQDHGVKPQQLQIPDELIVATIEDYTRESGVRSVEKQLAKIIRHTAKLIASGKACEPTLTLSALREALGVPKFFKDKALENAFTGVATGLSWTPNGGEIVFVEASISKGKGTITTTGSLGDVMKESAVIALEYVRAQDERLKIDPKMFTENNLHIHVPEGAIPKDGPSAGVTMVTAIASVFTGRKVRRGLAMTGEVTLRGKVLPVGGIKEKMLAAKRAGITDILLPAENKRDIEEIKEKYLQGLNFTFVEAVQEVLDSALEA
ncbi:MAG: endopeptidase La [Prevotellaceae bacterium]|jgi:ATP-dependent Lon protease|nr:endopeptidase La [Prevotellaceae bacterium]